MKLTLCPRCHRHVKAIEPRCPFCSAAVAPALGPSIGAAVVLGLAFTACPNSVVEYGPPIYGPFDAATDAAARDSGHRGDAAAGDARDDASQPSLPCPEKSSIRSDVDCAAGYVGMTCLGTAVFCGQVVYTDCTCQPSTPHTWFCGERSCSGPGSGPGADATSGRDAETKDSAVKDSTIHDTGADARADVGTIEDATKGLTDVMSGVMYGPATGDW